MLHTLWHTLIHALDLPAYTRTDDTQHEEQRQLHITVLLSVLLPSSDTNMPQTVSILSLSQTQQQLAYTEHTSLPHRPHSPIGLSIHTHWSHRAHKHSNPPDIKQFAHTY